MVFDHIGFNVADIAAAKAFFTKALAPMGTMWKPFATHQNHEPS
jgi:catechol 2,3-dioxygenase-like lactoylglutathione lyase family enzyme